MIVRKTRIHICVERRWVLSAARKDDVSWNCFLYNTNTFSPKHNLEKIPWLKLAERILHPHRAHKVYSLKEKTIMQAGPHAEHRPKGLRPNLLNMISPFHRIFVPLLINRTLHVPGITLPDVYIPVTYTTLVSPLFRLQENVIIIAYFATWIILLRNTT